MNIWLDGWDALRHHAWAFFFVLLMILWGQIIMGKILANIFKEQLTDAESLSLGLTGWILPVAAWATVYILIVFLFGSLTGRIVSIILLTASLYVSIEKHQRISFPAITLTLFALISLVLHSAFLQKATLPSYFDSAEHYRILKYFSETLLAGSLPSTWVGTSYYHAGYHLIGAAFVHFFQINISDFMLVFGQTILAILPLSLFFIARRATSSTVAAFITCLLAGFGWHMPSHLANWGKYPALLSLICMFFVLSLGGLLVRGYFKNRRPSTILLAGIGILLSILIHTRSAMVYAGLLAAVVFMALWMRLPVNAQRIVFALVVLGLALGIGFMQNHGALAPLISGYMQRDSWMLILVLVLTPFSLKFHAQISFFLVTSSLLFILALFIPIELTGFPVLTLLDRPYVQMLAYLPLSLLGGLGLSGLLQWMSRLFPRSNLPATLTVFLVCGLIVANASLNRVFYPSDCCQFASLDDLAALTWIDTSLPPDSHILIASSALYVTSLEPAHAQAGSDAGIWIPALTSRPVTLLPFQTQFGQDDVRNQLCLQGIDYIYIGGMPQSFDGSQFSSQPAWYRQVFALPQAQIYQLVGCE